MFNSTNDFDFTDVHHGNGTQDAFWNDPDCLFISLHQDSNYPRDTGAYTDIGGEGAQGSTINLPLPPGSGTGCYAYAFERVVLPALERFKPEMIFVSSGFDASYADPLAAMMLSSDAFRLMATHLQQAALINRVAELHSIPITAQAAVLESSEYLAHKTQDLAVAQQMQALLNSVADPDRRKAVLNSLSF